MKMNPAEINKIIEVIESSNLSASQVIELIKNSNVQSQKVIDTTNEIILTIDYTKTIEQVIAAGNYTLKNDNITTKNFPISSEMMEKKVKVAAKLFHFNDAINSDDAILEMNKDGYRPATLMELLALGFLFPELQSKFPIVALGSSWLDPIDFRFVPFLDVFGSGRKIFLYLFNILFSTHYRFLGVRK